MATQYFIQDGLITKNVDKPVAGLFNLNKLVKRFLNSWNITFHDECCDSAKTVFPMQFNSETGLLEYFNGTAWTSVAGIGGVLTAPQNDIAAGTGGAIAVTNYLTTVNTDAGGDAFTLANGTIIGQQKKILFVVDGGGDAVITPVNLAAGTTITLNDATDYVVLVWNGTDWYVIENSGATIA